VQIQSPLSAIAFSFLVGNLFAQNPANSARRPELPADVKAFEEWTADGTSKKNPISKVPSLTIMIRSKTGSGNWNDGRPTAEVRHLATNPLHDSADRVY
jgi:hypothetical protein